MERLLNQADAAGTSGTALQATIERLGMPLVVDGNAEQVRAQLEEHRKAVIREAEELAKAKEEYELVVREYNAAQCFTPVAKGPSRLNEVRDRGRRLNAEIDRDGRARVSRTASVVSAGKPKYSTPAKTL